MDDGIPASQHWILPSRQFQGLWEFLYFNEDIKENVYDYILFFSMSWLSIFFMLFFLAIAFFQDNHVFCT